MLVAVCAPGSGSGLSCSYRPHDRRLLCTCGRGGEDGAGRLEAGLRLDTFSSRVAEVRVERCPALSLALDLVNVEAAGLRILFRLCNKVTINSVAFETDFAGKQRLDLHFEQVQSVDLHNIYVDEKLFLQFENVREVNIVDSTFRDLSHSDITSLHSGPVCVANSILKMKLSKRPKFVSKCPWIPSTMVNISDLYPSAGKYSPLPVSQMESTKTETEPHPNLISISPSTIAILIIMIFCIFSIIIAIVALSVYELKRKRMTLQNPSNSSSPNHATNKVDLEEREEESDDKIPASELQQLRRSISAVVLASNSCRRSNSVTLQSVILATEEEFLC